MIGDLRQTITEHVLQVVNIVRHDEYEDNDDDLDTTGEVFGRNHVLGQ